MKRDNKIIVALDNDINDGIKLIKAIDENKELRNKVYGFKVGSLWVLDKGIDIAKEVCHRTWDDCNIILDMQKWPTDIPDIVKKQVCRVAETGAVDELIACPMGGGDESLEAFVNGCKDGGMRPLCALEMTHPGSDSYLKRSSWIDILHDAATLGIDGFVIPATKEPRDEIKAHLKTEFPELVYELYTTGYKVQEGQAGPMIKFGVNKYIIGRAIYEAENLYIAIKYAYDEINGI